MWCSNYCKALLSKYVPLTVMANWLMPPLNLHSHYMLRVNVTTVNSQILGDLGCWLAISQATVFFVWIGVGYVNFLLLITRRVPLTDSFWSCFCCSPKAFSFNIIHPSFPQTLLTVPVCTICHMVSHSYHLLLQLGENFGAFGLMEGSPHSSECTFIVYIYKWDCIAAWSILGF